MDIINTNKDSLVFNHAGKQFPVEQLTSDKELNKETYYVCGEYLYRYIGKCHLRQLREKPGLIGIVGTKCLIHGFDDATDEEKAEFSAHNIYPTDNDKHSDVDSILTSYFNNYRMKNNLVIYNHQKVVNTGELYIPELNDKDDALTRIMKLMIRHLKINRRTYKDNFDKDYSFDNLISALNGATVNMSITKFLTWCELLQLHWKFELDDSGGDPEHPVGHIEISDKEFTTIDYGEEIPGIFKVPLGEKDDPLKRLIKICIIKKRMVIADYKDRGSTPHLINNMRSALKRDGRMMFPYFIYWCEILGMRYRLSLEKDGFEISTDNCFDIPLEKDTSDVSDNDGGF